MDIAKHLLARVVGLILLPLLLYITIFAIHFVVLNKRYVEDTLITAHLTEYCNDDIQSIVWVIMIVFSHQRTRRWFLQFSLSVPPNWK